MDEVKMTLVERLRNPAYGQEDRLVADMKEGADAIDELRASRPDGHPETAELQPCPICGTRSHALMRGVAYSKGNRSYSERAVSCPNCTCRATLSDWQQPRSPVQETKIREALKTLLDCGSAITGADTSDPLAHEAFEMYNAARRKARHALATLPSTDSK